jgi:hypothetical protein
MTDIAGRDQLLFLIFKLFAIYFNNLIVYVISFIVVSIYRTF